MRLHWHLRVVPVWWTPLIDHPPWCPHLARVLGVEYPRHNATSYEKGQRKMEGNLNKSLKWTKTKVLGNKIPQNSHEGANLDEIYNLRPANTHALTKRYKIHCAGKKTYVLFTYRPCFRSPSWSKHLALVLVEALGIDPGVNDLGEPVITRATQQRHLATVNEMA